MKEKAEKNRANIDQPCLKLKDNVMQGCGGFWAVRALLAIFTS